MSNPELSDLAASFRRSLRAAGEADRTVVLYLASIRFFCDWLTAQNRPTTLDQLNQHAVAAWLEYLMGRNETSTALTRLRGLRRFCRWLVAEGELEKAPTEGLELPQRVDKPVPVLSDDDMARLLKTCTVPRGRGGVFDARIHEGRRDEVMLRVLADCELRVSELAGVELADIDLNREMVFVMGEGARARAVPFGAKTGQAIDRYLHVRSGHPKATTTDVHPAPVPAHICAPVARERWGRAGPDVPARVALRCDAGRVRPVDRCRAGARRAPADAAGRPALGGPARVREGSVVWTPLGAG